MEPTPAPRICSAEGCEARLRASNTIGRCREHAYIPAAGDVCGEDGCETVLRKDNTTGFCTPHKRAKNRSGPVPKREFVARIYPDRACPDCGEVFTPASANHERCPDCQHRHRLDLRAEREGRNDRDTCSVDGCDAKLRTSNTTGRCSPHRYIPAERAACAVDGCDEPLRKDNGTGYCKAHKFATDRVPVRICAADGCDNRLRADNESGYCGTHAWQTATTRASRDRFYAVLREQSARRRLQRPLCSADGCPNRLRSDNTTGRCAEHAVYYIPSPIDWALCSVDGCEARIRPDNSLGRCMEHRSLCWDADNPAPECGEPECGRTLYRGNQTGFCNEHRDHDEYNRQYYDRNQADLREYARQYRAEHPEEHRAYASAWNAANREARYAAEGRRRAAAAAGMDDFDRELSVAYRLCILHDPCFYCGATETHHVDHFFPLAKGGSGKWWNLVRSCSRCNHSKHTRCGTAFILGGGRLCPRRCSFMPPTATAIEPSRPLTDDERATLGKLLARDKGTPATRIGDPYVALVNLSVPRRGDKDGATDLVYARETVYLTEDEARAFNRKGVRDGRQVDVVRKLSGPDGSNEMPSLVLPRAVSGRLFRPATPPPGSDAPRPDPEGSSAVQFLQDGKAPEGSEPMRPDPSEMADHLTSAAVDAADLPPRRTRQAGR